MRSAEVYQSARPGAMTVESCIVKGEGDQRESVISRLSETRCSIRNAAFKKISLASVIFIGLLPVRANSLHAKAWHSPADPQVGPCARGALA